MTAAMKLKKTLAPWKNSYDQPRQHSKKQRHYFADKSPSCQSYSFSRSHVWMWESVYIESWMLKNWCVWTAVLEKTQESLGEQGDQTSKFERKSFLNIHWNDWCWNWSSNTLATWCEKLTQWKRPWGKIEGRRRGWQRMRWLDGITDLMNMSLSKL